MNTVTVVYRFTVRCGRMEDGLSSRGGPVERFPSTGTGKNIRGDLEIFRVCVVYQELPTCDSTHVKAVMRIEHL